VTSTKTDKSAIDLAGVEAGAKIFVPLGDELFGSLAHPATADQNRRSIVCASIRNVEDFILNVDTSLLPLNSEMRAMPRFALVSNAYCKARHNRYRTEFD